jgi:hypothetical protein
VNASRRFPLPWTFEDHNNTCFIVRDANGLAVAYVYCEEEPGRRTTTGCHFRNFNLNLGSRRANLLTRFYARSRDPTKALECLPGDLT